MNIRSLVKASSPTKGRPLGSPYRDKNPGLALAKLQDAVARRMEQLNRSCRFVLSAQRILRALTLATLTAGFSLMLQTEPAPCEDTPLPPDCHCPTPEKVKSDEDVAESRKWLTMLFPEEWSVQE
jgi:hypothetical protein